MRGNSVRAGLDANSTDLDGFGIDLECVRNNISGGKSKSKKPRSCPVPSPISFRNAPNIDAG
jgi:hypothetical protein